MNRTNTQKKAKLYNYRVACLNAENDTLIGCPVCGLECVGVRGVHIHLTKSKLNCGTQLSNWKNGLTSDEFSEDDVFKEKHYKKLNFTFISISCKFISI
jgi:hypothetical protein